MIKRGPDYGGAPVSRSSTWIAVVIALALGAPVVVVLGRTALERQADANEKARAFSQGLTVDGQPCPTLTAEQYAAQPQRAKQVFSFDMIDFGRRFGHVECGVAGMHGVDSLGERDVCQFTGPAVLEVKTGKGVFHYLPGIGVPATVIVQHGVATCVMNSKFKLPGA